MRKKRRNKRKRINKILVIVASSPYINTGFANVGKMFVRLAKRSQLFDEIYYIGYNASMNLTNKELNNPDFDGVTLIHEDGAKKAFGYTQLKELIPSILLSNNKIVIVTIGDPWNFYYMEQIAGLNNIVWVPYIPVESNIPSTTVNSPSSKYVVISIPTLYKRADIPVAYSKYGMKELNNKGIECNNYFYHMVDVDRIRQYGDTRKSKFITSTLRDIMGKSFVLGTVSANAYRKGIDIIMSITKQLFEEYMEDVFLILHVPKAKENGRAFRIDHLIRELDIPAVNIEDIISKPVSESGQVTVVGYDEEMLDGMYRAFDVYVNMSRAEGFGLPIIEAAARDIEVVVPDFGTPKEIAETIGIDNIVPISNPNISYTGTNQIIYEPSSTEAAKIISNIIHNKHTKPKYDLSRFDVNNHNNQLLFNELMESAIRYKKQCYDKVVLYFGETFVNGSNNKTYVINTIEAGIKDITTLQFVNQLYKNNIVCFFDEMSQNNVLERTYNGMLVNSTDEFNNMDIYSISSRIEYYKIAGSKVLNKYIDIIKPHIRRNRADNNTIENKQYDVDWLILVVSALLKNGSKFSRFIDKFNINKDSNNVVFSIIDFHTDILPLANIPKQHMLSRGFKEVNVEDVKHARNVVVPNDLMLDGVGLYLLNSIISGVNPEVLYVNSIIPTGMSVNHVLDVVLDGRYKIVQTYGEWNTIVY